MRIKAKKGFVFLVIFMLLFQDSIIEITGINWLNYADELFIVLLFAALLFKRTIRISSVTVKMFNATFVFFLMGTVYCLAFSEYSVSSLLISGFLAIKFFLVVIAVTLLKPKEELIIDILGSLKGIGFVSAITGVINFIFPNVWVSVISYTWIDWRMGMPSVMGLFVHLGRYGWFMLFVAILYYAEYKTTGKKSKRFVFAVYSLMAITSMKVKVIIGVGCVIFAEWFIVEKKKINIKKLAGSMAGITTLFLLFGNYFYTSVSKYILGTSSEVSARYILLNRSFKILKDYFPWGVGFGKYGSWYARINYSEYYYLYDCNTVYGLRPGDPRYATDTFWPAIIGETGILGTLLYICFLIFVAEKQLATVWNHGKDMFAGEIALFGFLVLIQSIVESMGEAAFNSAPQNIFVGFIVGLGICMGLRRGSENTKTEIRE